ncbi:hypothetical protein EV215_1283 [Hypnocyclicus thermotrophus]|uniref:Flagellin n=1 Tax=Hypnocyclicus thermotrophus TaxID=1627895 RepID=A0AA46I5B1_9FUSO|nr:hypothetical protein [Hypnocyclicus thermotrophus]TDT69748.1 hypothetical protein EV215_1283 [Hypnocyclicus thermotrophus]
MKLTGAYGGAAYKDIKLKNDYEKRSDLLKKASATKNDEVLAGEKNFEMKTNEILRKIKYYQTEISVAQNGSGQLSEIQSKLEELRKLTSKLEGQTPSVNYKDKADALLIEVEKIAKSLQGSSQKALNGINLQTLGLDEFWISDNKLEVIDEAIDDILARSSENKENINKFNKEIKKLQIASENTIAASSRIDNPDELNEKLSELKEQINDEKAISAQANVSQARVMNVLED